VAFRGAISPICSHCTAHTALSDIRADARCRTWRLVRAPGRSLSPARLPPREVPFELGQPPSVHPLSEEHME
jgi:hypothetical protein